MADYYTCDEHAEQMHAETADEAIEECLDGIDRPFPATLRVYAYVTDKVGYSCESLAEDAIDRVYEILDGDYGDPGGDPTDPTPEVVEAARAFTRAVLASYRVWRCTRAPAEDVTVNVAEWILKHGWSDA